MGIMGCFSLSENNLSRIPTLKFVCSLPSCKVKGLKGERARGRRGKGGAFTTATEKRPSSSLKAVERCIARQRRDESPPRRIGEHFSYH